MDPLMAVQVILAYTMDRMVQPICMQVSMVTNTIQRVIPAWEIHLMAEDQCMADIILWDPQGLAVRMQEQAMVDKPRPTQARIKGQ